MSIPDDHLDEMKALAESGDISIGNLRTAFFSTTGQQCTLSDDDVLRCCGWQDDDYGDEDIVHRMAALQAGDKERASMEGECT